MAKVRGAYTPSSEDWDYAVLVIKMVEDFAKKSFRRTVGQLARVLEREGLAAHRSADRLEKLSEFAPHAVPLDHRQSAILAKIADCYTEPPEPEAAKPTPQQRRHVASDYLARLSNAGLEDPRRLRQQAAILLDAAETIDKLLRWYKARRAIIMTRDLTNDTIVAIMREWGTKPRETANQLTAHGHAVKEGTLKTACGRTKGLGRVQGGEEPLTFYVPALRRRQSHETGALPGVS